MKWLSVALFIGGTSIAWGLYAPVVQIAAEKLGSDLRAFLFVGLTYFVAGVVVPGVFILSSSDPTVRRDEQNQSLASFSTSGAKWGLAAGLAGAAGAVCMILALAKAGPGAAVYVGPIVFAMVPLVNTAAVLFWLSPTTQKPDWRFLLGLLLAILGAALVVLYKPTHAPQDSGDSVAMNHVDDGAQVDK